MRFIKPFSHYALDRIVHSVSPKKKHAKRLATPLANDKILADPMDAPVEIPPANSSEEVKAELITMDCMIDSLGTEEQAKMVSKYDEDFHADFQKIVEDAGYLYPKQWLEELVVEAAEVIIRLKYRFNRPRPYELAPVLGIDLKYDDTNTAKTPSFPSGHAAQSTLMAYVLSELYPDLKIDLYDTADEVAYSRFIGGLHFPSDLEYGKIIGKWLGERTLLKDLKSNTLEQTETIAGEMIKPNVSPNLAQQGSKEDDRLLRIRQFKGTVQDYKDYWDDRISRAD